MKEALREVVAENTAGSPTRPGLLWTHLPTKTIAKKLLLKGFSVCRKVVQRLLDAMGFRKRRLVKSITKAPSRNRDAQFRKIGRQRKRYASASQPVFSVDSKRKEWLGAMHRRGEVFANQAAEVFDHALPGYSDGEVIPHGIYDVSRNAGHINLNAGKDTGEFAVASLRWYWRNIASKHYPEADSLLLLCDCGGSNNMTSTTFKYHLWQWAVADNMTIEVAHYPVYCSKYNPIERRLFPYVEQAWSGQTFDKPDDLAEAARTAATEGGLTTTSHVITKQYEPIRSSGQQPPTDLPIKHARKLPDYNYVIPPEPTGQ